MSVLNSVPDISQDKWSQEIIKITRVHPLDTMDISNKFNVNLSDIILNIFNIIYFSKSQKVRGLTYFGESIGFIWGTINVSTEFHGNPSSVCWDISVWTDWPKDWHCQPITMQPAWLKTMQHSKYQWLMCHTAFPFFCTTVALRSLQMMIISLILKYRSNEWRLP